MKLYEILEHTADLKIRAYGRDLPGLFSNALKGMFEAIRPTTKKEKKEIKRDIEIESVDREALLVDFLSEALYLSDINNETYLAVEFSEFGDNRLKGKISGFEVSGFDEEIKAVTYHGVKIEEKGDRWEATVLFDI